MTKKSDTDSEKTDVESPSTEDSTSTQQLLSKCGESAPNTLNILFCALMVGLIVLCFGIGIYSFFHLEDLERNKFTDAPAKVVNDDDIAFDIRPTIDIDMNAPTATPSESPLATLTPTFVNQYGDLLQELRSIFGVEIAVKISNKSSPLSMAFHWVIDQDEYSKANPRAGTVQRFILAAFYFSTGGRRASASWNVCSAVPETTGEDENNDRPIRCVFDDGETVCATPDEFLECPEYYRDWAQPPATPDKRWLSNSFECDWYGISCDGNEKVYAISLPNNGLEGALIPEITALGKLTHIDLQHNAMGGPLPSLNNVDIHELLLSWNNFGGRLELSDQWPNLERLELGDGNSINISMSPRFGLISSRLKVLDLSGNHVDSGLPDQARYNWGVLGELRLSNCEMDGSLPQGFNGMPSLTSLDIQNNQLTGTLPSSLWGLLQLQELRLDYNQFHGELSPEIGNLVNLRQLSMVHVGLTGRLPTELSMLQNLESVSLQHNVFESRVPDGMCSQLPQLHTLQADCGWAGFPCSCCTLCCEAIALDPQLCHSP